MEEEAKKEKKSVDIKLFLGLAIGIIVGALIMFFLNKTILGSNTIISTKKGNVSEKSIFNAMKNYYVLSFALEETDKTILSKVYPTTNEMKKEAEEEAAKYISTYESYGYSKDEFLQSNGFKNYDEFIDTIVQNNKMELYYYSYIEKMIPAEDIKNFYDNKAYGDINSKHILVKTSDTVSDEDAQKLAKTIISELDAGATFDEEVQKYGDKITYEELGYNGFNSSFEESFTEALKTLEKDTYSKEPVKTSYGYHVIYCIDKQEKKSLEECKSDIVKALSKDLEESDSNLYYKAMIQLRKDYNMQIKDSFLAKQYEEYVAGIESAQNEASGDDIQEISFDE